MFLSILAIFWQQEYQYSKPTPVPRNLKKVKIGAEVNLSEFGIEQNTATLIHFFNYDCPCSRFNIKEFKSLVREFKDSVSFFAVISGESVDKEAIVDFNNKYDLGIQLIIDYNQSIADSLGVYSTPQAVIIDANNEVYYKGNYNKARYCVSRNTRFVEKALSALVRNEPLPFMPMIATIPYGCAIEDENESNTWYTIFN